MMDRGGLKLWVMRLIVVTMFGILVIASSSEEESFEEVSLSYSSNEDDEYGYVTRVFNVLWQNGQSGYEHVWPEMELGWKIILGTVVGFLGAAFGSVGGVGGGGIFVPMLTLIIGFDAKSSTAISKCMITGAAAATVSYNLKRRHPMFELPLIDYDLALLFQPMLVLGISIGVTFNVMFADWMITVLLIILFIGTSTKAFLKGVETWKRETIMKKEATKWTSYNGVGREDAGYIPLPGAPSSVIQTEIKEPKKTEVSILENVPFKELGLLVSVWVIILALEIAQNYTPPCSVTYWALNLLQVPVAGGLSLYEAISLYKGRRVITSKGETGTNWKVYQLVLYCATGILAGVVGGLLGLGGGFILGPLFLELGVPPQVSSATATFAMTFSSSMSVVEYYLLERFPVPYALYFIAVAIVAALVGQHLMSKLISILGRSSLIIFILAFTIFVSAILLGGVGIEDMIEKIEQKAYMGFDDICSYEA